MTDMIAIEPRAEHPSSRWGLVQSDGWSLLRLAPDLSQLCLQRIFAYSAGIRGSAQELASVWRGEVEMVIYFRNASDIEYDQGKLDAHHPNSTIYDTGDAI